MPDLVNDIEAAASASPGSIEEGERLKLLAACEKLRGALENPFEATVRIIFGGHRAMALRLASDMKLFDAAAKINGGEVRLEQLAAATGADPLLIIRIMRMLAGMGVFKEVGKDTFISTPLAATYVTGSPLTDAVTHITFHIGILSRLPEYFEEHGFQSPSDAYDGPFQFAMGTKQHYFEWLRSNPKHQQAFNTLMTIGRMNRGEEWFDFYPVEEKLQVAGSEMLLIDIGGGLGHDLIAFKQRYPQLPGKLMVQDLPIVIDDVKDLPPGIEAMKHDFFAPEPIKNAKAYYFRNVFCDWPDKQAREILNNIKAVMNKESLLLINEAALPDSNIPLYPTQLDMSMIALFSSLYRTLTQFKELLDSAGFEVVQIWTPKVMVPGAGTLFEAVLKK